MNAVLMTMLLVAGEAPQADTQYSADFAAPYYVDPVVGVQRGRTGPRNKTGIPLYKAWLFRYTIRNGTTYLPAYDYRTQFDYSWHSRMLKYRLAQTHRFHAVPIPEPYDDQREEISPLSEAKASRKPPVKPSARRTARKASVQAVESNESATKK